MVLEYQSKTYSFTMELSPRTGGSPVRGGVTGLRSRPGRAGTRPGGQVPVVDWGRRPEHEDRREGGEPGRTAGADTAAGANAGVPHACADHGRPGAAGRHEARGVRGAGPRPADRGRRRGQARDRARGDREATERPDWTRLPASRRERVRALRRGPAVAGFRQPAVVARLCPGAGAAGVAVA